MQEVIALSVATTEDLGAEQVENADDDEEQEGPNLAARAYQPLSSSSDDEMVDNDSEDEESEGEMEAASDFKKTSKKDVYVDFKVDNGKKAKIYIKAASRTSFLNQLPPNERSFPLK